MNTLKFALMFCVLAPTAACTYGTAVAVNADRSRVVILRNDIFLFGALRRAFVCKASDGGLVDCQQQESP